MSEVLTIDKESDMIKMASTVTLAEEFHRGPADREVPRQGFALWNSPTRGVAWIEPHAHAEGVKLHFADGSELLLRRDGSEELLLEVK